MRWIHTVVLLHLCAAAGPDACLAQEDGDPVVAVYGELFGNTAAASVNMDIRYESGFLFRFGGFPLLDGDSSGGSSGSWRDDVEGIVIVTTVGTVVGEGAGRLETGLGATFGSKSEFLEDMDIPLPAFTATFGYRYQPRDRSVMLRIGFTPLVTKHRFVGRIGFSIGWTLDAREW